MVLKRSFDLKARQHGDRGSVSRHGRAGTFHQDSPMASFNGRSDRGNRIIIRVGSALFHLCGFDDWIFRNSLGNIIHDNGDRRIWRRKPNRDDGNRCVHFRTVPSLKTSRSRYRGAALLFIDLLRIFSIFECIADSVSYSQLLFSPFLGRARSE